MMEFFFENLAWYGKQEFMGISAALVAHIVLGAYLFIIARESKFSFAFAVLFVGSLAIGKEVILDANTYGNDGQFLQKDAIQDVLASLAYPIAYIFQPILGLLSLIHRWVHQTHDRVGTIREDLYKELVEVRKGLDPIEQKASLAITNGQFRSMLYDREETGIQDLSKDYVREAEHNLAEKQNRYGQELAKLIAVEVLKTQLQSVSVRNADDSSPRVSSPRRTTV